MSAERDNRNQFQRVEDATVAAMTGTGNNKNASMLLPVASNRAPEARIESTSTAGSTPQVHGFAYGNFSANAQQQSNPSNNSSGPSTNNLGVPGGVLLQQLGVLLGAELGRQNHLVQWMAQTTQKRQEEMNAQIQKAASILAAPPGTAANLQHDENSIAREPKAASCDPSSSSLEIVADDGQPRKLPPGSLLVPCRARGMPKDHNSKVRLCCFGSFQLDFLKFYICFRPFA